MKNHKSKVLIVALLMLIMTFTMTGCGEPTNLEQYVKQNDELAKELESYCSPGMTVTIEDNTLTYTYAYEQEFIDDTVKLLSKELKNTLKIISPTYVAVKERLVKETGFEDIVLVITYTDAKGTVLRSQEY